MLYLSFSLPLFDCSPYFLLIYLSYSLCCFSSLSFLFSLLVNSFFKLITYLSFLPFVPIFLVSYYSILSLLVIFCSPSLLFSFSLMYSRIPLPSFINHPSLLPTSFSPFLPIFPSYYPPLPLPSFF